MIYSLVSREQTVLCDYTPHSGNFSQVALEVIDDRVRSSRRPICLRLSGSTPLQTTVFIPT
jgi:hypothetical protein